MRCEGGSITYRPATKLVMLTYKTKIKQGEGGKRCRRGTQKACPPLRGRSGPRWRKTLNKGDHPGESPHIAPHAHHTLPYTRLVRRRLLEDDGNTRLVDIRRLEKRGKEDRSYRSHMSPVGVAVPKPNDQTKAIQKCHAPFLGVFLFGGAQYGHSGNSKMTHKGPGRGFRERRFES